MKKLYTFLQIALCLDVIYFAASAVYQVFIYTSDPACYIAYSAPWYTELLLTGILSGVIALLLLAALLLVKRKLK